MDVTDILFGTVGGLGLFLFGMRFLSEGLKRAAGDSLRALLAKITKWSVLALLVGAGVTCLIQSSSATTVMLVGLVNAGLLTVKQAIGVVLGANIGTTFTAWLVAGMSVFKVTRYALPAIGVGFALNVLGRRRHTRHVGQILLGFGILFVGISFMQDAFAPLHGSPHVVNLLTAIGDRPILAVAAGAAFTMVVQSSSASIAMIQTLAFTGAFGADWHTALRVAIPFVLGDNIGTTITAQLAALQTNLAGRRAAMAHTLFNVIGVLLVLPLVYAGLYPRMVEWISPFRLSRETIMVHVAISHSLFNVVAALAMLPATGLLERAVMKLLPPRRRLMELEPVTLERHLLETPPLAIDQARREITRMARTAKDALDLAVSALCEDDLGCLARVGPKEAATDDFQTQITRYLVELSQQNLEPHVANELPVLLHTVNDIERVGDHAINIAEIAQRKIEERHAFSPEAEHELARMRIEVSHMFDNVLLAIDRNDQAAAEKALQHEEAINAMQMEFRHSHVERFRAGTCEPLAGLIYIDFVNNMEKIGDHLTNVAQGVLGNMQWDGADRPGGTSARVDKPGAGDAAPAPPEEPHPAAADAQGRPREGAEY